MKTIPFSLDKYIPGKSIVQTRDGRSVRILATDVPCMLEYKQPIAGIIEGTPNVTQWSRFGTYWNGDTASPKDLFIVVESKLRAFSSASECPVGCLVRRKSSDNARWVLVGADDIGAAFSQGSHRTYSELFEDYLISKDNGKTWLPCGIMEDSQ